MLYNEIDKSLYNFISRLQCKSHLIVQIYLIFDLESTCDCPKPLPPINICKFQYEAKHHHNDGACF